MQPLAMPQDWEQHHKRFFFFFWLTPFVVAPYHYLAHQVDMMVGMVLVVEGGYGGASAEALDVTTKELRELFGGIGQVSIPSALSLLSVIDGKGKTRMQIFFNFIP